MPNDSDAIDQIFWGALQVPSDDERRTFLDQSCGSNTRLRQRVEKLLKAKPKAEPFLEQPFAVAALTTNQPRSELGPYKLLKQLGRGGMGVVYEAEQVSLGRRVALKILPFAALLNEAQLERFATEATAAARLQHSNIVTIYSVGCERGIHFIAMQLIEGPSLAEVIAELRQERHPCDNEQQDSAETVVGRKADVLTRDADGGHYQAVARIGCEAAEALQYAHENGVLHRDIKPSNLLLDQTGHVWIADFGLARVEDESQLTRTGDILGTLHYMSPEQATGQRDQIDARSDVYGLGATLYELATLRPVFDNADRGEVIKQVVAGNPVAPHTIAPGVPRPLSLVISKAMTRRLDERYQSAHEMADDLNRFLEGEPVKAKPRTPLRRAKAWSRRHRLASTAIVSLLILILLLPFSMHHFYQRVPDDSQTKGHDMKVSKTAKVAAAAAVMAIVTAGVNAKKPPKPPPEPGLTVHSSLLGADWDLDYETSGSCGVLVEQQDGKYLTSGIIRPQGPTRAISQLTRWNVDVINGTAATDPTFGNNGRFVYDFSGGVGAECAWNVAVQPDPDPNKEDRIIVVGGCNDWRAPYIARLNIDGSLDQSFHNGVVDEISPANFAQFFTVTILGDGSIVAGGMYVDNTTNPVWWICPLVVKFTPDGQLDTSFGQNGVWFLNLGGDSTTIWGNTLAELEDGRLIMAGSGPNHETSTIFMLTPNGSLDLSFGNGGLAEVDFNPEGAEFFHALVMQPDGKIVAVGGSSSDPFSTHMLQDEVDYFTIARFNSDGTLDKRSFAKPRGKVQLDLAPGGRSAFTSVQLLSDGKLLAVGSGDPGLDGTRDIYLARFSSNGKLDTSFDEDGWASIDIADGDESHIGLSVLADSLYLISGTVEHPEFGFTQFLGRVWEE